MREMDTYQVLDYINLCTDLLWKLLTAVLAVKLYLHSRQVERDQVSETRLRHTHHSNSNSMP